MNLHAVVSNGRSVPVETRKPRRVLSAREAAERLFKKRCAEAANVNQPRILEAAPSAMPTPPAPPAAREETEHEKVFRLVGAGELKAAARLAAKLINAGDFEGFFIYGTGSEYRRATDWFRDQVALGRRGIHATVHTINPARAQVLLSNNVGNRKIRAKDLEQVMRDIAAGTWDINGETMKVAKDGSLNDSQHRNYGVLLTGGAIKSLVAFGLPRESMRTVDIGGKRTAADRATMAGKDDAVALAAAAALAYRLYNGREGTPVEIDEFLDDHEDELRAGAEASGKTSVRHVGRASPTVAAMHLLSIGAHRDDIRAFFNIVRTGLTESNTNPARAIYNALNPTEVFSGKRAKLSGEAWVRTFCAHFVLYAKGKRQRLLIENAKLPEAL